MQKFRTNRREKASPIVCALVVIVFMLVYLAIAVLPLVFNAVVFPLALAICILYGGAALAVIIGVSIALYQRLSELNSGEENDAKQY